MAKTLTLLTKAKQQIFIICSLFIFASFTSYAPNINANAFAAQRARISPGRSMMTIPKAKLMRTRHQVQSLSLNAMRAYSSGHNDASRTRCRTLMKVRKRAKTVAVAIASLLLATKPAFAEASIISSASEILNSATTPKYSYNLTRILFLRLLAIVYTAAFSVAKFQNKGLIGDRGITPARKILDAAEARGKSKSDRRKEWIEERKQYSTPNNILDRCKNIILDSAPMNVFRDKFWHRSDRMDRPLVTLLWLARDRNNLNPWLDRLANVGLFLSTVMLATGSANFFLILGLWLIQRSLMSVGGPWYGYGWEPQLAELTFHALFLVPLLSMNPFFGYSGLSSGNAMGAYPVPILAVWVIRWYLFKIMIGAGLIKVKSSDQKWKPGNMSAMDYFYETQPVPNPFTRYFHYMPKAWHRFEVWSNHFVELVAPFLLLMPFQNLRIAGGLIQIMFQTILISSGNLSFLNWLTIVPAIFCLDDAFLIRNLPNALQKIALGTPATQSYIQNIASGTISMRQTPITRAFVSLSFFLLMAKLNKKVIQNLLSRPQLMNGSFDKLRLCGTYGAFGVVSEERVELIIESARNINGPWKEYQFKVKPGDVHRRPRWISPYHHRIDWQMWIASATGRVERSPWIYSLLLKLLRREKDVTGLLESDPWEVDLSSEGRAGDDSDAPKYIRIEKYRYKFYDMKNSTISNDVGERAPYWIRERVGRYFPREGVVTADMLEDLVKGR